LSEQDGVEVVRDQVTVAHLMQLAGSTFGDLVKAVVDVEGGAMAIGGAMHADEEAVLIDLGCRQRDLWGINLYPEQFGGGDWIEFDSMINVRPGQGNRSRDVEDPETRRRIVEVVTRLVQGG
jgi:hypothetical protein